MNCEQAQEWITALVDSELSKAERAAVEAHIGSCPECHKSYELERAIKQQVKSVSATMTAPAALRQRVEQAARSSDRWRSGWFKLKGFFAAPFVRPALAAALLLLVMYPMFRETHDRNIGLAILSVHGAIESGSRSLARVQNVEHLKNQLMQAAGGRFAPMGFDLSELNLYPVAGFHERIDGRDVLVTVYEGEGPRVTCFTFLGSESEAPRDAKVFFDEAKKIRFYSYGTGEFQAVMHREGEVICVMVSKMPAADLLAVVRDQARHS